MQNLTVIENELVPVYETSTGEKVVYGSELHEVLGVRTPYKDWSSRRLLDVDAIENEVLKPLKFAHLPVRPRKTILSNLILPRKWQCLSVTKKVSRCAGISSR
mgnify:CR=1 FL=1